MASRRHDRLVLHLDVNKTLVMCDPAAGKSVEVVVRDLISDATRGIVTKGGGGTEWTALAAAASAEGTEKAATGQRVLSYHAYVEDVLHPYACVPPSASAADRHAVHAANAAAKVARSQALTAFFGDGAPGAALRADIDAVLEKLRVPATGAFRFVIPAYFEMLRQLHSSGRDFRIVFRTFGTDIAAVAREHNAFCEGRHPAYPGVTMDGSDGGPDRRLRLPQGSTRLIRFGARAEDTVLAFVAPDTGVVTTRSGFDCVREWLRASFEDAQYTLAVQDCYEFWFACGEVADAGKLFVVSEPLDGSSSSGGETAIFFDDNIRQNDAYIVDARGPDGRPLAFHECLGRCLVRVDPLAAVTCDTYFLDKIAECEANIGAR